MRTSGFLIFLAISFAISIPLFMISTTHTSAGIIVLLLMLGSFAPAAGARIAVTLDGDEEEKRFFQDRLRRRARAGWFVVVLLVPSGIWLLGYGTSPWFTGSLTPAWNMLAALPLTLLVNFGEEIGWRGYALPFLMKRFHPAAASLVVGMIWGLFHASLYWQRPAFGMLTFFSTLVLSLILAWMFVNTKSILPGTLFHATFNTWTQVFVNAGNTSLLVAAILFSTVFAGYLLVRYGKELVPQK